jgi:hypothetical protein
LDWAKTLVTLNTEKLDTKTLETTMSVLLKHESDLHYAKKWLQGPADGRFLDDRDEDYLANWRN